MTTLHLVLICGISLALPLAAVEGTVTFETDMEVYSLTFNQSKISEGLLRKLAWLSPYMPVEIPSPYIAGSSEAKQGIDKRLLALRLEDCSTDPDYRDCNGRPGTRAFFHNAQINIERSQAQLKRLASLHVPRELAPVQQYLQEKLGSDISIEKARLAYYRSWDTSYLVRTTKAICGDDADLNIISRLQRENRNARYRSVRYDWATQLNSCINANGVYPIQSWNTFLSDYGIHEKRRFKRID